MQQFVNLDDYLRTNSAAELGEEVRTTILALCNASERIASLVARGPLAGDLAGTKEENVNVDGDEQKELDLIANDLVIAQLREAPVATLVSEELDEPMTLAAGAPLYVAVDPLDGSSNIETNAPVGTIFSLLRANPKNHEGDPCLQKGTEQLAAGYVIYGPQTALLLTTGNGTDMFTLDPESRQFRLIQAGLSIPPTTREFAINVSNFRHWDQSIRAYVDACMAGADGYRKTNYNMRWLASLVAEAHRIFARGGIFLYPGDARKGYSKGRLRLLYEVNPISFLVEQAGGSSTTGVKRSLDVQPTSIHQRVPLIFGSRKEIDSVERYCGEPQVQGERSQLFNRRGLFR